MNLLGIIVLIIVALLFLGILFTSVLQDLFIFSPVKLAEDHQFLFKLPFEEITLETPYAGKINLLWFRKPGKNRPLILYSHGNSSNLSTWGLVGEDFDKKGFDVLVYDYRGFGKSRGIRNEKTFLSDAMAVYDFALKNYKKYKIVLYGRSMGTGVSAMLASKRSAQLLILETPYHSMRNLFKVYYPFLPAGLFLFKYNFPNHEWIRDLSCPVYVFHGTEDTLVPYSSAVALKPLLQNPENFVTIEGAGHNDLAEFELYNNTLDKILKPLL